MNMLSNDDWGCDGSDEGFVLPCRHILFRHILFPSFSFTISLCIIFPGSCKKPLDIVFLLDTSIPIPGEFEFKLEKEFVSKVLQRFEQSSRYTKAAIVEYSTNAVVSFSFNNFTTPSGFENYLQKISCKAGQTRYDRALHLAESQLFSSQGGARPFAHRVVVLITNNEINHDADDTYKIENLKNACKKKCIQIFAVGIEQNGKDAASRVADTSDGHLLQVDSFNDLAAQASQFSNKICAGKLMILFRTHYVIMEQILRDFGNYGTRHGHSTALHWPLLKSSSAQSD